MSDALVRFLAAATPSQRAALVKVAGTSLAQLQHVIAGRREASSTLAARIEQAAAHLRRGTPRLPHLDRRDISSTCKACPLVRL